MLFEHPIAFPAEIEMEQYKTLLRQQVQTAVHNIAAAQHEGQSEEATRQLYDKCSFYADKLHALEQPAVPIQEGVLSAGLDLFLAELILNTCK